MQHHDPVLVLFGWFIGPLSAFGWARDFSLRVPRREGTRLAVDVYLTEGSSRAGAIRHRGNLHAGGGHDL